MSKWAPEKDIVVSRVTLKNLNPSTTNAESDQHHARGGPKNKRNKRESKKKKGVENRGYAAAVLNKFTSMEKLDSDRSINNHPDSLLAGWGNDLVPRHAYESGADENSVDPTINFYS